MTGQEQATLYWKQRSGAGWLRSIPRDLQEDVPESLAFSPNGTDFFTLHTTSMGSRRSVRDDEQLREVLVKTAYVHPEITGKMTLSGTSELVTFCGEEFEETTPPENQRTIPIPTTREPWLLLRLDDDNTLVYVDMEEYVDYPTDTVRLFVGAEDRPMAEVDVPPYGFDQMRDGDGSPGSGTTTITTANGNLHRPRRDAMAKGAKPSWRGRHGTVLDPAKFTFATNERGQMVISAASGAQGLPQAPAITATPSAQTQAQATLAHVRERLTPRLHH